MPLFSSSREKRLWICALAVFAIIVSSLFIGQPLARALSNQNIQAVWFGLGMVLVAAAIVVHGLRTNTSKIEITISIGIIAVYVMFIFRLGAPERSHIIEYSVLAIFILSALNERINQGGLIRRPALIALVVTFLIGVFDECIQIFLPNRVFDPQDILFNGMAAVFAIGSTLGLTWVRKLINRPKLNRP